ncbi:MAG TPA: 5-formyltetrahydrofolate cyclo-ligase [Actinomycetota bacterium]|nr:5-formyltetrahydrofolate cyclo-ligase [Actinomycetota bacterium]
MNSNALKRAKRRIRREILERRDAIGEDDRVVLGAAATERLLSLPEVRAAGVVMAFSTFGSEVPTRPLIEGLHERGATVALPRIEGSDLVAVSYAPGDRVRTASFGAREPLGDDVVDPADLDVVVVPGVAFDLRARRVGYGAGFYDRFLGRTDAFRVALAFEVQVLDEDVPTGRFDVPLDAVVTEGRTIRPST